MQIPVRVKKMRKAIQENSLRTSPDIRGGAGGIHRWLVDAAPPVQRTK
jgi:hypothetical protein